MENKTQEANPWQKEEANKLKRLFDERKPMSQLAFGDEFDIGTQGMVSQYLLGRRPLNISAAKKFALGLGVSINEFSPRLAKEIEDAAAISGDSKPTNSFFSPLGNTKDSWSQWPFHHIDQEKIKCLSTEQALRIETAIILTAAQFDIDIQKS